MDDSTYQLSENMLSFLRDNDMLDVYLKYRHLIEQDQEKDVNNDIRKECG